ncbi:MAG: HEAT repeat domain-containing protein [Candidatus Heimdallarchaeota archaeon]
MKATENTNGSIIGSILALGIIGSKKAESVLLEFLENEVDDIKLCAYWALGKVGSPQVLSRMAQILESNPKRNLIPIAERAILTIDPNYPLAGVRENVLID